MAKSSATVAMAILATVCGAGALAQSAPPAPDKVWHSKAEPGLDHALAARPEAKYDIDAAKVYTLAELIDLAEQHNPRDARCLAGSQSPRRVGRHRQIRLLPHAYRRSRGRNGAGSGPGL